MQTNREEMELFMEQIKKESDKRFRTLRKRVDDVLQSTDQDGILAVTDKVSLFEAQLNQVRSDLEATQIAVEESLAKQAEDLIQARKELLAEIQAKQYSAEDMKRFHGAEPSVASQKQTELDHLKVIWLVQEEMKKRQKEIEAEYAQRTNQQPLQTYPEIVVQKHSSMTVSGVTIEEVKKLVDEQISKIQMPDIASIKRELKSELQVPPMNPPLSNEMIDERINTVIKSSLRSIQKNVKQEEKADLQK